MPGSPGHLTLSIDEEREPYVLDRLEREGRGGRVVWAGEGLFAYDREACTDDDGRLLMEICYDAGDELELLIRVLSFGPLLVVHGPERLVALVRERVERQRVLMEGGPVRAGKKSQTLID